MRCTATMPPWAVDGARGVGMVARGIGGPGPVSEKSPWRLSYRLSACVPNVTMSPMTRRELMAIVDAAQAASHAREFTKARCGRTTGQSAWPATAPAKPRTARVARCVRGQAGPLFAISVPGQGQIRPAPAFTHRCPGLAPNAPRRPHGGSWIRRGMVPLSPAPRR